ncbi:hypothetical protein [Maledivibacter halophilus]|uniref:Uncharacterized protein n=1 Tax=Maledivibacter halophilus TaxID=36842 RepID=A0A1T5K212_9FIRM|nr:hypothetical protein [Maledivibacter halophilus]SKC57519.1 hypothetical protein SAMN02194393_01545 [Maledivibacter halophilus]
MVTLILKEIDGEIRAVGYATLKYSTSDPAMVLFDTEKSQLDELAGENWQNNIHHFKLKYGDIVFDENLGDN